MRRPNSAIYAALLSLSAFGCESARIASLPVALDAESPTNSLQQPRNQRDVGYREVEDSAFAGRHDDYMAERDWRLERPLRTRIVFQPETGVEDRGSDFQLLDLEGRFRVRQAIGPDTQWIFGGELGIRSYEFSAGGPGDGVLYRIVPELGVAHFAREDIYVEASFLPSIRSSFEGSIGLDHVFWNFEALGTWRYQEGLMFDGGFAISDEYGGTKLIPLLGVRAQLDPNWRVDALLPRHIEISWNNLERTTLYGGWYREGADYRVKETFLSGAEEHDIFVSEIRVAAGVDYQLTDSVQGWAELGFIAGGDIEMRPGNVAGFEGGLETEPYVRVGFAWSW